jgi:hypothetical protein
MRDRSRWLIFIFFCLQMSYTSLAQDIGTKVNCGDTVEGEFTQRRQYQLYTVTMSPGDKLKAGIIPIGEYLVTRFEIFDPAGGRVLYQGSYTLTPVAETSVLSARGEYNIFVYNDDFAGVYTLLVGCTLRDGTEIAAGSVQ